VQCSTFVKHPRVVEGRGTEESTIDDNGRRHGIHGSTTYVEVNGPAKKSETGRITKSVGAGDIKRVIHGDNTIMRRRSSPNTMEKHSSTTAVGVKPEGVS
jgi:hypothetical protein